MEKYDFLDQKMVGFVNELSKNVHFLQPKEKRLYLAIESIYMFLYEKTGDWQNLLKICAVHKKCFKKLGVDIIDIAFEALKAGSHPDSVVYFGISVVNNLGRDQALIRLREAELLVKNENARSLLKIFEAAILWKSGDYSGYVEALNNFCENKKEDFNPYISIPVSTAWRSVNPPFEVVNEDFPEINSLKTQLPNYRPDYIISVSCDSVYFDKYSKFFIKSLASIESKFYCHISISDSVDFDIPDERVSIVNQNLKSDSNIGPISSALRFLHAYDLMSSLDVPVIVLDFDVYVKKDFKHLIETRVNEDLFLRRLGDVMPWEKITAGFGVYFKTEKSLGFLKVINNFLFNTLKKDISQWWVDQNALECASRFVEDCHYKNVMNIINDYVFIPTGSYESKIIQISNVEK